MSTLEVINIGATANDGTGDPLRTAFEKINYNFAQLGNTSYFYTTTAGTGNSVLLEFPANSFNQASFLVESTNSTTSDKQTITITALPTVDDSDVKYNGYGTIFIGNAVANYSMDVLAGNVRLICNPLTSDELTHNIAYQLLIN